MLLVDDGEAEIAELHCLLEQRVRAGDEVDAAVGQPFEDRGALAPLFAAGQDRRLQPGLVGQRRDCCKMLARQDFGRRHQCRLRAGLGRARHRQQRHHRLAGADIALQQPQHALGPGQVGEDFVDGPLLRSRQRIGQGLEYAAHQPAVAGQAGGQRAV